MTAASIVRALPTANDNFKNRYPAYVRAALVVALVVHALAFILVPAVSVTPYHLPIEEVPPLVEVEGIPDPTPPAAPAPLPPRPGFQPAEPVEPAPALAPPPPPPPDARPGVSGGSPVGAEFHAFFTEPVLIAFTPPAYPPLAREAHIEGTVLVRVLVDEAGRVADAVVLEASATPGMVESALRAARACRFEPARQRDVAVPAHVTIPFAFKLR